MYILPNNVIIISSFVRRVRTDYTVNMEIMK